MNKFEKLVEYIINDEDQKARELFHAIVVEKSRDIYESIMDEEHMEEMVHGDEIGDMDKEIGAEESMHEEEDGAEEEFSLDDEGDGKMPADDEHGEEEPMHLGGEEAEHEEIEDKVMNIDTKLDELLAKFDEIMGDKGHDDMGAEEPAGEETPDWEDMGGEEPAGEEHHDAEAEHDMMEGEQPEWLKKGSGKSGMSGKSGKSGSAMSGKSGKSGSGKTESRKTAVDMMREYVEKIEDITLTPSTYSEGEPVGSTGKKTSVNTKSVSRHEGPDFGGESKNIARGGSNENPDGKPVPKANNEYTKGQGEIKSGNRNVPGGKAGKPESTGHEYTKDAKGAEGQTTGGKVPVYDKSVQKQNTGRK
jgi:hypothetical protein